MPLVLIAIGLFTVWCSIKEYDFFMNDRRAKFMIKILGRKGTRIFYIIFGSVFLLVGVFLQLAVLYSLATGKPIG
ncbi:Imm17 family immunity protein [Desulfovibrio litoralis]|nr:Imm17 family immunity protein [Desulfovibrio litoralis]